MSSGADNSQASTTSDFCGRAARFVIGNGPEPFEVTIQESSRSVAFCSLRQKELGLPYPGRPGGVGPRASVRGRIRRLHFNPVFKAYEVQDFKNAV